MNTFELIDIAFTGREQRRQHMDLAAATAFALDRIYKAFDRRDPPGPQQPMCRYPDLVEGPSHHDGTRTAGAVDPNYCRICTPKGYGCCHCEIACNE